MLYNRGCSLWEEGGGQVDGGGQRGWDQGLVKFTYGDDDDDDSDGSK